MLKLNTIVIEKKKYYLVPAEEYRRLAKGVPSLPEKTRNGNYPALPAIEAGIARNIVRDREAVGMSQKELAEAAGIRVEILNRAERGVNHSHHEDVDEDREGAGQGGLEKKAAVGSPPPHRWK